MSQTTLKCPICGKPYTAYMHYAGDQSACPECRMEARRGVERPSNYEEKMRRFRYFGTAQGVEKGQPR